MRTSVRPALLALVLLFASASFVGACSSAAPGGGAPAGSDSGATDDARSAAGDDGAAADDAAEGSADSGAGGDAADAGDGCFLTTVGVYGRCMTTAACQALGDHTSTPGFCPGPSSIECCTKTPNVADNPSVPAGWQLMPQSAVTPDMTSWAVMILNDPATYPMFSTTTRTFGSLDVLARVEWHPPDFQNAAVHRGVTLYEPL